MSKKRFPPGAALPDEGGLLAALAAQSRPMRLESLLRVLGLPRRAKNDLEALLSGLAARGLLLRLRGGGWTRTDSLRQMTGRFSALPQGGGFVTPLRPREGGPRGIRIPAAQTGGAWHNDVVRVALAPGAAHASPPEGRVLEIVERTLTEVPALAGRRLGRWLFCRPADSRLAVTFRVEAPPGEPAPEPGALLLLAPLNALAPDLWTARLAGCFGREDNAAVKEELVKCNHAAPRDFSPAAMAEADVLPDAPTAGDMTGREDVRSWPLATIDGADARDFDDALDVEDRPGGGWLLRVAIADVSHYVRPRGGGCGGALDAEARERGNSWYFPCSVAPMLPPALCDGLCSLKPGEDRLAVLAELPVSAAGRPGRPRFALVVMRSAARLTYDQVKACLLDRDPAALSALRRQPRGGEVLAMLERAFALYAALRDARLRRGSLDFDIPEPACRLDKDGRVAWLGQRARHDAHRLVEECMIATNEAVARHLRDTGLPFPWRVHPRPDAEKLEHLWEALSAAGLGRLPPRPDGGLIRQALADARGTDREFPVSRLCLRAMPQARYQPDNEGHFGLASDGYCHFTSPIRRYADLLVHRALKAALGQPAGPLPAGQRLLRLCDHLNRRERAAMEAEREMNRRLGCLALAPHVGRRFRGVVAGVLSFGIFVELSDMPVEGMIRVEDLGSDWYDFDPRRQCLTGRQSGMAWRMGQAVEVTLAEVDLGRLEIRLVPHGMPLHAAGRKGRAKPGTRPGRRGGASRPRGNGPSGIRGPATAAAGRHAAKGRRDGRSRRGATHRGGR